MRTELGTAEETLLELAASLDPTSLRRAGQHLVAVLTADHIDDQDPEAGAAVPAELSISRLSGFGGGGTFRGSADAEGLAVIEAALSPLSAPCPATAEGPDTRTAAQRRGEALIEVLRRPLATDQLGDEGGTGVTLVVTTTARHPDHRHRRRDLRRRHSDPRGGRPPPRLRRDGHPRGPRVGLPAVGHRPGHPGRPRGDAPRPDPSGRHCAFPGCETPAMWCDAHHITYWSHLGDTALDNLVLLCGRHHRLIHHSDWDVVIGADGHPVFHPPPWLHPDITMADPTWRTRINTDYGGPPDTG